MSRTLHVLGIGFWARGLPDWTHARAALRGGLQITDGETRRPAPTMLPAAERRRVPDSVALALEVATQAVTQSGRPAAELPTVFASTHGDLAITDYVCSTLVEQPTLLSPTKFHNSVHNAAAGYWTIGTQCLAPSSALAAFDRTFAAGFVEAASIAAADDCPVLLAAYDVDACGALASVTASRGLLAYALVLSPTAHSVSLATIGWGLVATSAPPSGTVSAAARDLQHNAAAPALPLFEALAASGSHTVTLPLDRTGANTLQLNVTSPESY
jgi:hypothetical protein